MNAPSQTVLCWNCRQPLSVGATTCLWCGVAQQAAVPVAAGAASPAAPVAPGGPVAPAGHGLAVAPGSPSPGPVAPGAAAPGVPGPGSAAPMPAPGMTPGFGGPAGRPGAGGPRPAGARAGMPAGDRFRGTIAGTGARVAAFTIDVVLAAALTGGVWIASSSAVLGGVALLEFVVFLWVLEARTGLTPGNAALRVRTSRADAPFSPGMWRALVRHLVTGAGFLGAVGGAWVVVASGAFDGSRRGRSWPDKASGTLVVAVPPRERTRRADAQSPAPVIQRAPARLAPQVSGLGKSQVMPGLARPMLTVEDSVAMSQTGVPQGHGGVVASEHTAPPVPISNAHPATATNPEARVNAAPPGVTVVPAAPPQPTAPPASAPAPQPAQPQAAPAAPAQPPVPVQAPAAESAQPVQPVQAQAAPAPAAPAPATPATPAEPAAQPATPASASPASAAPADATPEPAPQAAEARTLLLIFDTGQREQVPLPAVVNLGRKPAATEPGDHLIAVTDPEGTVSKNHLRLEHSRGRTWVTDGGSTNGTELLDDDGSVTRLAAGQRTAVDEGTRVRIGNRAFTISVLVSGGAQ